MKRGILVLIKFHFKEVQQHPNEGLFLGPPTVDCELF